MNTGEKVRQITELAHVSKRTVYHWITNLTPEAKIQELRRLLTFIKTIEPVLSAQEVATQLRVHKSTVYRWAVTEGRFNYYYMRQDDKGTMRFSKQEIDTFAMSLEEERQNNAYMKS